MGEKRLQMKERDKDFNWKRKIELEQKRITTSVKEKIAVEILQFERKKVEAEEKIAVMKEKEKLAVSLSKSDLKKYDGNILK